MRRQAAAATAPISPHASLNEKPEAINVWVNGQSVEGARAGPPVQLANRSEQWIHLGEISFHGSYHARGDDSGDGIIGGQACLSAHCFRRVAHGSTFSWRARGAGHRDHRGAERARSHSNPAPMAMIGSFLSTLTMGRACDRV